MASFDTKAEGSIAEQEATMNATPVSSAQSDVRYHSLPNILFWIAPSPTATVSRYMLGSHSCPEDNPPAQLLAVVTHGTRGVEPAFPFDTDLTELLLQ